jgi:hypothetical protein
MSEHVGSGDPLRAPVVVGLTPWLPRVFAQSAWWTEPVRAERLAALRIGVALAVLVDVCITHWPYVGVLFGEGSLGAPEVFGGRQPLPLWQWSPLRDVGALWAWHVVFLVWTIAALFLLLGVFANVAAAVALLVTLAVSNPNPFLFNAGDFVRNTLLFYLMLSPCAAVWSVRPRPLAPSGPVYIPPWPLRLLFVHMAVIYFLSGMTKLPAAQWRNGETIYYVMASLDWTHWSYASVPVPYWMTRLLTWITLVWEIGFPFFACWRRTRLITLLLGVFFHVFTNAGLRLGLFGPYMLCLYLPLVPWERWLSPGVSSQESGVRGQESEVRSQGAEIRADDNA